GHDSRTIFGCQGNPRRPSRRARRSCVFNVQQSFTIEQKIIKENMMKKAIILIGLTVFVVGCGNKSETKFEGVSTNQHDYMAEGVAYLQKSDVAHAIQSFDQAIKQNPRESKNYIILGQVYMNLK